MNDWRKLMTDIKTARECLNVAESTAEKLWYAPDHVLTRGLRHDVQENIKTLRVNLDIMHEETLEMIEADMRRLHDRIVALETRPPRAPSKKEKHR